MAYIADVNHDTRIIDFAFYTSVVELVNNNRSTEEDSKTTITKLTMVRTWLKDNREFFTIKEISEILGVSRKTIEIQGIWKGKLKTYKINYFFTPNGTPDKNKWVKKDDSNLKLVVHKRDLKEYLLSCTKSVFHFQSGSSIIVNDNRTKDDLFREKSKLLADSQYMIFLKHNSEPEEIENLIDQIIDRKKILRSKSQLQRLNPKSDTSYTRFMKCYDHIRFNFTESVKKDTVRMIFENMDDEELSSDVAATMKIISNYKVKIIEKNFDSPFEDDIEFNEPLDYFSLYLEGYRGLPDGYYGAYFVVESKNARGYEGIDVKVSSEALSKKKEE